MAKLKPEGPPGRANRKARAYTAEIVELVDAGYTLAAIQEALRGEGVDVSRSTVHRELHRGRKAAVLGGRAPAAQAVQAPKVDDGSPAPAPAPAPPENGTTVRTPSRPVERRGSSLQQAEDFARSHVSNPLLRKRERK